MDVELSIENYLNQIHGKELLWEDIKKVSKEFENKMNSSVRKFTGSYYTSLELTEVMIKEIIEQYSYSDFTKLYQLKFLEPCVGVGNFVFTYLRELSNLKFKQNQYVELLNNIYVCDINDAALSLYKKLLKIFAKVYFEIDLSEDYFEQHIGTGLLFDVNEVAPKYISIEDIFKKEIVGDGFDIVVTNPPYKNLKVEKSHYNDLDTYNLDKEKYSTISTISKKVLSYSTNGVLNLYKLFVEEIIEKYTKKDGIISLLIPASILSDKTCEKLRSYILMNHKIISIKVMGEGNNYIDAQQALCSILIHKNAQTDLIKITKDFCKNPEQVTEIQIEDIINKNTGNAIFGLNDQEYYMLKQLRKFPVIKDLSFIINMRGELDLTANKKFILNQKTNYRLLRGKNIDYYTLSNLDNEEYVDINFVNESSKKDYIFSSRIICQQVVNIHKERRVTFAYIDKDFVLGNSCNFISVLENQYGIDLYFLLGLFNSSIINWYFKLTSSNNHVNNYEIDCFPIPVKSEYIKRISDLAKKYLENSDKNDLAQIEKLVHLAYEINIDTTKNDKSKELNNLYNKFTMDIQKIFPEITEKNALDIINGKASFDTFLLQAKREISQFDKTVGKYIVEKYIKIINNQVLNHTTFKLSELDMEMVRAVPQGGSWKDIPEETVKKSKRLARITETGGRTTLYGRIDYKKPSYTITTYFNRPGNGTYIHPIHNRVLSVREAARFQSFKDDYFFYGNKSQVLKQVGNAVPTLMAYQIAKNIVDKCNCEKSIDLFCGAGGMTAGFKEAGIHSVLSNDIEESACITLKINNPEINVFCGDITQKESKDLIVKKALEEGSDLICGGPPCQGFSMAGLRLIDDPRNQLFKEFVEIVSRVKPKVIVFENVQGFLTFQGGAVYKSILELFSEVGYYTEGRLLLTSNYAVPQKRKRVIIICTRKDIDILPKELFPCEITEDIEKQISAYETISDLEDVGCSDSAAYGNQVESKYIEMMKGKISYNNFIKSYTTDDFTKIKEEKLEQMTLNI